MKRILTENWLTMAMAFFLAVLTWMYLFSQGNGSAEIEVLFQPPRMDESVFASVRWEDAAGGVLEPGGSLRVRISGLKGDVNNLRLRPPKTFVCQFPVNFGLAKDPLGAVGIDLDKADYGLAPHIHVQPLPKSEITLRYVKYVEKEIALEPPFFPTEGQPQPGYRVESVTIFPERIKAKVPADRATVEKATVRSVPVGGRVAGFTQERWELGPDARERGIQPQEPFRVDVRISAAPATRKLTLDLSVAARPEHLRRIQLVTTSVPVEVQGPEELVRDVPETALAAYVVVTDRDMESDGNKLLGEAALGCHVLDPRFRGRIEVLLMRELKPENRQVTVKVLPK
jgi:hypothetical protein